MLPIERECQNDRGMSVGVNEGRVEKVASIRTWDYVETTISKDVKYEKNSMGMSGAKS